MNNTRYGELQYELELSENQKVLSNKLLAMNKSPDMNSHIK